MAPQKPTLQPLKTKKTMIYPSELLDSPLTATSPTSEHERENSAAITPPPSYTEFVKVFTPIFGSPTTGDASPPSFAFERPGPSPVSMPSSAASSTFFTGNNSRSGFASVPSRSPFPVPQSAKEPRSLQRLNIPSSYALPPATPSPKSAYAIRSPYGPSEWRRRYMESPRVENGQSLALRHVTTTTITFKRTPRLNPPPEGKRRRTDKEHDSKS